MHPILAYRSRALLYLAAWLVFGGLLAVATAFGVGAPLQWALAFALPMAVLLGVQSLSSWYLVRVLPAAEVPLASLMGTWLAAWLVYLLLWVSLALGWAAVLRSLTGDWRRTDTGALLPLLLFAGSAGFIIAVLGHYLAATFERTREAEHRALELRIHAREAEMSFLRGQLDPHFLFNCLNSIAALLGSDTAAARRMCFLMADFFRSSLKLGARQAIALGEELRLAETFLAIEEVRFGERLRKRFEVAPETLRMAVPPLLLQPLVENAVHHGIAHLLSGGEISVGACLRGSLLELSIENSCDPERPASRGTGLGLANVRGRVEAMFGPRARLDVQAAPERFRVLLILPGNELAEATSAHSDRR
jgi:two-component system, LytTR family, sensor histidine kinase AlgZ